MLARLAAAFLVLVMWTTTLHAGVVTEEYLERKGAICEPRLLPRRIAENLGTRQDFLKALQANSVQLRMENTACSGTYITPTCVLTAAHCLIKQPENGRIHSWNGRTIATGGRGYIDPHYRPAKKIGESSGDDLGVVVFNRPYANFREITLSAVKGNMNLWFHEANGPDSEYRGSHDQFDYGHWRDLGDLGLTGYANQTNAGPFRICSDSAFDWAPCYLYKKGFPEPIFERGVVCTTGELGDGMSGGSFYNQSSLFGVIVEAPGPPPEGWSGDHVRIKNHRWYRHPDPFSRPISKRDLPTG